MITKNKEFFLKPYYFFLTEKNNKLLLYYSIGDTILESRKMDEKIEFDKKDVDKVKKGISDIVKSKKFKTKDQIKKYFTQKPKDELGELVDIDGTMTNSKIPILDKGLTPKKTTDQTVVAARMTNNPITRGYRKYYGESTDSTENVVNEVDYSEAFGYEETKDMDGEETYNYLIKKLGMEPDEAFDRTKQFGKDPYGNKTKNAPKSIRNKKGFIDRMTLSEIEKDSMIKMVEDILLKNKNGDAEIDEREEKVTSKIVKKNIQALKKMAEKEGITINQLIKLLKSE